MKYAAAGSVLVLALVFPTFAAPPTDPALQRSAVRMAQHLVAGYGVMCYSDDTNGLQPENVLVADLPFSGNDLVVEEFLRESHGRVIADEILDSYRENRDHPGRITAIDPSETRIVQLDSFVDGPEGYKWGQLQQAYPGVKAVVRMSEPAVDSQGAFAVVRYDVITPRGFAWGVVQNFEHRADGTWRDTDGIVGWLEHYMSRFSALTAPAGRRATE